MLSALHSGKQWIAAKQRKQVQPEIPSVAPISTIPCSEVRVVMFFPFPPPQYPEALDRHRLRLSHYFSPYVPPWYKFLGLLSVISPYCYSCPFCSCILVTVVPVVGLFEGTPLLFRTFSLCYDGAVFLLSPCSRPQDASSRRLSVSF